MASDRARRDEAGFSTLGTRVRYGVCIVDRRLHRLGACADLEQRWRSAGAADRL
jgi:hypothetical protein